MCFRRETALYVEYLLKALGHNKWGPYLSPADISWQASKADPDTVYSFKAVSIAEHFKNISHEAITEQALVSVYCNTATSAM
jgi:hypothetical protein